MLPILLFLMFAIQELPFEMDLHESAERKWATAPKRSLQHKVVVRLTADCASRLEKILLPHQQQALSHIAVRAFLRQQDSELFEWPLALREDLELTDSETKLIETKTRAIREKFDSVVAEEFSRCRESVIQLFPEESRNEIKLFLERRRPIGLGLSAGHDFARATRWIKRDATENDNPNDQLIPLHWHPSQQVKSWMGPELPDRLQPDHG